MRKRESDRRGTGEREKGGVRERERGEGIKLHASYAEINKINQTL